MSNYLVNFKEFRDIVSSVNINILQMTTFSCHIFANYPVYINNSLPYIVRGGISYDLDLIDLNLLKYLSKESNKK